MSREFLPAPCSSLLRKLSESERDGHTYKNIPRGVVLLAEPGTVTLNRVADPGCLDSIVKAIPGSGENRSPSRRNHCSPSPRNPLRLRPESAGRQSKIIGDKDHGLLSLLDPDFDSPQLSLGTDLLLVGQKYDLLPDDIAALAMLVFDRGYPDHDWWYR